MAVPFPYLYHCSIVIIYLIGIRSVRQFCVGIISVGGDAAGRDEAFVSVCKAVVRILVQMLHPYTPNDTRPRSLHCPL